MIVLSASWADATPQVRVRSADEATSHLEPLVGLRLGYRTSKDARRHCVGHVPFRKGSASHVDCANRPRPGQRTCANCAAAEATFASNLHHAHNRDRSGMDSAVVAHLDQPNLLYLAAFRDGSVKVGTTTEARRDKRLSEQGAWRALLVARTPDGFGVRVLEDKVTADLGVAQSVSVGRKLTGMAEPRSDAELERTLHDLGGRVRALVQSSRRPGQQLVGEPWSFPADPGVDWHGLHRYPVRLDTGAHDLVVRAACGRLIVVERPDGADRFVADIGQLFGVELDVGDHGSEELAVQDSLF